MDEYLIRGYKKPYRSECAKCSGPIAIYEKEDGQSAVAVCPGCSDQEFLTEYVASLPTLQAAA
jgi:hypothetical protein